LRRMGLVGELAILLSVEILAIASRCCVAIVATSSSSDSVILADGRQTVEAAWSRSGRWLSYRAWCGVGLGVVDARSKVYSLLCESICEVTVT